MIFVYIDRYISPFEGGQGGCFYNPKFIKRCFYNPKFIKRCFYNPKFIEGYSYNQRVRSLAPNSHRKYINN